MILKKADDHVRDITELEHIAREYPFASKKALAQIDKIKRGQAGESNAAHFLDRELRDSKKAAILHDVRLDCGEGDYAQIDHLIIHRVQCNAYILETKHYAGNLTCNEHGDWTVFYGKRAVQIPSPVQQAKRQAIAFRRWLKEHEIRGINDVIPLVLVNPHSRINRKHLSADEHVIKSDNYTKWVDKRIDKEGAFVTLIGLGRYLASGMEEMELRNLGQKICRAHEPANYDWEARMGVSEEQRSVRNKRIEGQQARVPAFEPLRREPEAQEKETISNGDGKKVYSEPSLNNGQKELERRTFIGKAEIPIDGGSLTIFRYENGDRGIRCNDKALIDKVATLCRRHKGKWAMGPKFWIVGLDSCKSIVTELGGSANKNQPAPCVNPSENQASGNQILEAISTPHGDITIRLTPHGYAIRNPNNADVIEAVRSSCKGVGRWNPMFKNWLVDESSIQAVQSEIQNKIRAL